MDEYKTIKGFPSYSISATGVVVNRNEYHNRISYLKSRKRKDGYHVISLSKDNKAKYFYLHRLIADHFIPNPKNKKYVNHKDGDKSNNRVSNLEWCTASENSQHAIDNGMYKPPIFKGEDHSRSKITDDTVRSIRALYEGGNYTQTKLSEMYGIGQTHISRIVRGESWSHVS